MALINSLPFCPLGSGTAQKPLCTGMMIAVILSLFLIPHAACASDAHLVVPDKLCLPGDDIFIQAYLYRDGILGLFRPEIQGELLRFFDAEGTLKGERLTDPSGMARIRTKAVKPGLKPFTVQLAENPRYRADPSTGNVFIRSVDRPLFFVLIEDGLMAQGPSSPLWKDLNKAEPLPGSVEKTRQIASQATLVFLTPVPMALSRKITDWIQKHAYPLVPVLFLNQPLSEEFVKGEIKNTEQLESMWKDRTRPACLVTGNQSFAESAADKGFDVFFLEQEKESDPGKENRKNNGMTLVHGWDEIPSGCDNKQNKKSGG